jgi:endonuclease YncB( thermonuclease family)
MWRPSPLSRWKPRFGFLFLLLLSAACFMPPQSAWLYARTRVIHTPRIISGEVVGVTDGDTIKVLVGHRQRKVRLYGVDTPEKKQAYGMKAKLFTSSLVFGKVVQVTVMAQDRYGRTVGVVALPDGRILNRELVRNGYAWWYSHYAPHDRDLQNLERQARLEKKELWSDPHAIAPWDFRRNARLRTTG